jgi:hypothetical protein
MCNGKILRGEIDLLNLLGGTLKFEAKYKRCACHYPKNNFGHISNVYNILDGLVLIL